MVADIVGGKEIILGYCRWEGNNIRKIGENKKL